MKSLRHIVLIVLFAALAAVEIAHGLYRLDALHERHRDGLIESIEREHQELATSVRRRLEDIDEHAVFLASMPLAREVARQRGENTAVRRDLESYLLPFLLAFRDVDRIRLLTREGLELVRCERIGKRGRWASALPISRLTRAPDATVVGLAAGLAASDRGTVGAEEQDVAHTTLLVDSERVEVPESERQVIHYVTNVHDRGRQIGIVALTVYASPLLAEVRDFAPLAGTTTFLVDADGSYLAHPERAVERGGATPGNALRDFPDALLPSSDGGETISDATRTLRSTVVSAAPRWSLVTVVPETAFDSASAPSQSEHAWVVGSVVIVTLILLVAAISFVRLSIRELRVQEAERQKDLERQLEISERLSSLGLLTAGVAHEINNPLEGIGNYLALLEKASLPTEKRMRYLKLLREGFDRIRDIVRDLQDTARPTIGDGTADLADVVDQALKLALYDKKLKHVSVEIVGLELPVVVRGDAGRLQQVLLNLVLNAGRAVDGSGRVTIRARRSFADGARWVEVSVEDDGPGIPAQNLGKIFDPFFTTTEGTGIGLSISFSIARAHGGTLTASNGPEGGACLTLRLPAAADDFDHDQGAREER